jgi:hypothetical protein
LKRAGINPENCTFEMTAIGPIFDEQEDMPRHKPLRDKTAALESGLADELKRRGYNVLGRHPRPVEPDPALFQQVISKLQGGFPARDEQPQPQTRFQPIKLQGNGPSASEMLLRDRERIYPEVY